MALPYLTFGVGRLLHMPSAEAYQFGPVRNPDVTKGHSNRLWSQNRLWSGKITSHLGLVTCSMVVPIMRSCGLLLVSSSPSDYKSSGSSVHKPHHHAKDKVADHGGVVWWHSWTKWRVSSLWNILYIGSKKVSIAVDQSNWYAKSSWNKHWTVAGIWKHP